MSETPRPATSGTATQVSGTLVSVQYESMANSGIEGIAIDHIIAALRALKGSAYEYDIAVVKNEMPENPAKDAKIEDYLDFQCLKGTSLLEKFIDDFTAERCRDWLACREAAAKAVHVIISTGSGTGRAEKIFSKLVWPFLSALTVYGEFEYSTYVTKSADTITELTNNVFIPLANKGVRQSIILLSGDGGILDILNALIASSSSFTADYVKPDLAILPLGTGNALANSTGAADPTLGLATIARGLPTSLPVFQVSISPPKELPKYVPPTSPSLSYGAVVFSWCMHASLVADSDTPEYRKHGSARFQMAAKEALFPSDGGPPHAYKATLWTQKKDSGGNLLPWQRIERTEHAYVLVTLVSQLEKGFMISPKSQPLDGQLRLIHFGPMSGEDAMKVMTGAFQGGTHIDDPRLEYEDVEGFKLEFDGRETDRKWRRVCIDGKIIIAGERDVIEVKKWNGDILNLIHLQR